MAILIATGLALGAMAHVRLINPGSGSSLKWADPSNVSIVIQDMGSDNVTDGSSETALRNAIQEWNAVSGTTAKLVENSSPSQTGRTDWNSSSIHLLMFDETNSSGYFPIGSGTVALTPLWFYSNGTITDADVLFNGKGFGFSTEANGAGFDIQDVATHELGHLLGLDHTGVAGATMYPYVDQNVILHRSVSQDEVAGMRAAYPAGNFASISGRVLRSGGAGVAGAWVSARDGSGRLAASALADSNGLYLLSGLDAGSFTVYARPLDKPVSAGNLGAGHSVETDFEATYLGGSVALLSGQAKNVGNITVGADVSLGLGRSSDNFPLRVVRGTSTNLLIHGSGLAPGSTLEAGDSSFGVATGSWFGAQLSFAITVPANAKSGLVDLEVINSLGQRSILPGALEVTPANPTVTSSSPPIGSVVGGTALIIKGTSFEPGARVVIGNCIYRDGESDGCTVLDSTTIMLTTKATMAGGHDVVVIDATGVEGRLSVGHTVAVVPTVNTVFPLAGNRFGGTEMVLRGENFVGGAIVRINGVAQPSVVHDSANRIVVTTTGGIEGGPYLLEIENPGGAVASSAFTYVRPNDPQVLSASPATGPVAGGETVTISGSNFTGGTRIIFGADVDTGLGGVESPSVTLVDPNTLLVEVPANSGGSKSIMARQDDTAQAGLLPAAYSYTGGGSKGGGCGASVGQDFSIKGMLGGGLWIFALLFASLRRRARSLA